jgi:hypothetical protein
MPSRFEKYRLRNGADFDETLWNRIVQDIDRRITATEDKSASFDAERQKLVEAALRRLDEIMAPVVDRFEEYASLGALLTAFSDSSIETGTGIKVFVVAEEDRSKFAAPGYLAIVKVADPTQAMLGMLVGYNAETGELTVDVDRSEGSGFHSGWMITAGSATDNAAAIPEVAALKEAAETAAGQALARKSEAEAARDAALEYRDEAEQHKDIAHAEAETADNARNQAQIAQAATEAARDAALGFMRGFLGSFTAPTVPLNRVDGGALQVGDWYFKRVVGPPSTILIDYVSSVGPTVWRSLTAAADTSVTSFAGRTGGVNPAAGDYSAALIAVTAIAGLSGANVQDVLASIKTALDAKADAARTVTATGLASGGGSLAANRTIDVPVASQAEAEAGTATDKAMNPLRTKQAILALAPAPGAATTAAAGVIRLATSAEALAGTDTTKAVAPAGVKAAVDQAIAAITGAAPSTLDTFIEFANALGNDPNFATTITTALAGKLNASSYTAADVLAKLLTVDGAGTGLDADTVDGIQASAFALLTGAAYTGNVSITTDAAPPLILTRYGAQSSVQARRANGTAASPTAVTVGDVLASWAAFGWDGSAFINAAYMRTTVGSVASGRVTVGWTWGTMNAAGVIADRMSLDSEGNLAVAGTVQSTMAPLALQSTSISAGTGLTGGGSFAASRTLSFDVPWGDTRYSLSGHVHLAATTAASGFMSATDKLAANLGSRGYRASNASETLIAADLDKHWVLFGASHTLTIPTAASFGAGAAGGPFTCRDSIVVTFTRSGSDQFYVAGLGFVTSFTVARGQSFLLRSDGTSVWEVIGLNPISVIAEAAYTGLSAIDLTLPPGFRRFKLYGEFTPSAAGASMNLLMSTDGGASFITSAGAYAVDWFEKSSGSFAQTNWNTRTTGAQITGAVGSANLNAYSEVDILWPRNAGQFTMVKAFALSALTNANGAPSAVTNYGTWRAATEDNNAIRLLPTSGTFSGWYRLEGIR